MLAFLPMFFGGDHSQWQFQKELAAGEEGGLPEPALSMSDQELEEYKVSHTPKSNRRR